MVEATFSWRGKSPTDLAKGLKRLQKEIIRQLKDVAVQIGLLIVRTATRLVAVDTGNLRASLDSDVQEIGEHAIKVLAGSNVGYATIQEVMQPYLRPALRQNTSEIERLVGKAQQQAVKNVT